MDNLTKIKKAYEEILRMIMEKQPYRTHGSLHVGKFDAEFWDNCNQIYFWPVGQKELNCTEILLRPSNGGILLKVYDFGRETEVSDQYGLVIREKSRVRGLHQYPSIGFAWNETGSWY